VQNALTCEVSETGNLVRHNQQEWPKQQDAAAVRIPA
jgi:hypothetical protein